MRRAVCWIAGLLACTAAVAAPGDPQGPPVVANATTAGDQQAPHVDALPDGSVYLVYTSADGDGRGVFLRRIRADGSAGPELRVNLTTAGEQFAPRVAAAPDGSAAVIWTSDGQDGDGLAVVARRIDAQGTPVGAERIVNQTTAGDQQEPDIAWRGDGFVAVWTGANQDGDSRGVAARLLDATAAPRDGEFTVNQHTTQAQFRPRVAASPDGRFVVVWQSFGQDGDVNGIYARRYAAQGSAAAAEFAVNVVTANSQERADVAMAPDGSFIVAFTDFAGDGDGGAIVARRFAADGAPLDGGVRINEATAGDQTDPALDVAATGTWWIAWQDDRIDGDGAGIRARLIGADGAPIGAERTLNTVTAGDQLAPAVAVDADGDLRAAWTSPGEDGDGLAVVLAAHAGPGAVDVAVGVEQRSVTAAPGGIASLGLLAENRNAPSAPSGVAAIDAGVGAATALTLRVIPPAGGAALSGSIGNEDCVLDGGDLLCRLPEALPAGQTATASARLRAPTMLGSTRSACGRTLARPIPIRPTRPPTSNCAS